MPATPFEAWSLCIQAAVFAMLLAVLVVFAVAMDRNSRTTRTRGATIVSFQFAGSPQRAHSIMDRWGEAGRRAARRDLVLDIGLIVAYALGLSVVFSSAVAGVQAQAGSAWAWVARLFAWLPLLAGVCDLIENGALAQSLRLFGEEPGSLRGWPRAARVAATAKWGSLGLCGGWATLVLWPLLVP
jgi:hypothetical protein